MELEIKLNSNAICDKAWAQYVERAKKTACDIPFDDPTNQSTAVVKSIFTAAVHLSCRICFEQVQGTLDLLLKGREIMLEDAENEEESEVE